MRAVSTSASVVFQRYSGRAREIVVLAQEEARTDLAVLRAILRRDGRVADWLRTAGVDEAWVREFGG